VGHSIFRLRDLQWDTPSGGDLRRSIVRLSDNLRDMRANVWRLPPGSRGRRHAERVQEELFVALAGDATMVLGDPPERLALSQGSLAIVEPGTPLQVRNEGDDEAVVLIVGAPPVAGEADYLPDVD
jgi:mannose-6-phosphate isomerase-like protein (cupin superfamily)